MAPTMPPTPSVFTRAPPPDQQPTRKKPAQLTEEQLNRFFHDGFLILHDIGELEAYSAGVGFSWPKKWHEKWHENPLENQHQNRHEYTVKWRPF